MADSLKVFKNQVAATKTATLGTTAIDVVATASNQQAMVKDILLSIAHSNPLYANVYKYPAIVKLGNFPLTSVASAASLTMTGTQVVDASSTLTIEIQPEAQKYYFGTFKALMPGASGTSLYTYDWALIGSAPTGAASLVAFDVAKKSAVKLLPSNYTGRSGCTITVGGATKWCYTNGSTLTILSEDGTTYASYDWPVTTNAIVADGTYIYGKSASSNSFLYRYNYTTLAAAANFALDTTVPGYGASNKGFVDSYNGIMYIKINGSDAAIYRINLTTGVTNSISCSLTSEYEFLGGTITVNQSGIPFIIMFGDASYEVLNLNTLTSVTGTVGWPTPPTTTSGNNVISIANGLAFANNGSYSTTAVIDVNGSAPVVTQTSSVLSWPSTEGSILVGMKFQTAPPAVTRDIIYNLLATGVDVTN